MTENQPIEGEIVQRHGDSFDVGHELVQSGGQPQGGQGGNLFSNPQALMGLFNINQTQAETVSSVIIAAGAGLSYKYLRRLIGDELSAIVGAGVAAHILKRLREGR